jgi:hypothetical protein
MELKDYFASAKGTGVLATADAQGRVNAAVYSRPHFLEDGSPAFVMPHRLTHANLQANPQACFLFQEAGSQREGRRLYLTMLGEDTDMERINSLRRVHRGDPEEQRYLVWFRVDRVLPLIGGSED